MEKVKSTLVEHLVRSMEQAGFTIEAAEASGHRKPGRIASGLRRPRFRPHVVSRDGRRTVFGIAKTESEMSKASVREELDALAAKCRTLVVCVPQQAAREVVSAVLHDPALRNRGKIRLLRHPDTDWKEAPKPPARKRPVLDHAVVRVIESG